MTYSEMSNQLALDSSVAALVLMGAAPNDLELIPLKPRAADENMLAELRACWPGRGLHSVGVIGLCGASPLCAFKEPLEPEQLFAVVDAFLAYVHVLLCDDFASQQEKAEIAELERLFALQDSRIN